MGMSIGGGGGWSAPISKPVVSAPAAQASKPAPAASTTASDLATQLLLNTSGNTGTQVNKYA